MRKVIAGIVIAVGLAVGLSACGGPSLTAQEKAAVQAVEKNINNFGPQTYTNEQVVGQVAKDSQGNKVTLVYLNVYDVSNKTKWSLIIIIVETPKGQLVFADADIPSGMVTVQ